METISAPNGTKFIKPNTDCILYEEADNIIYGRIGQSLAKWLVNGEALSCHADLVPAPKPWYENIGKGKLCWVWDDEKKQDKSIAIVDKFLGPETEYQYRISVGSSYRYAQPLTQEEAIDYLVKE